MDDLEVADENSPSPSLNGHSGITLVLPSLRALKAANAGKHSKSKPKPSTDLAPKIPRPIKLKPLKEVLTKLIAQIKKKDDYAFFIHPVDPGQVPGYTEMIKQPMDFGTMSVKVARGKYRSLDEFTNDFRLVMGNAKMFNPPGSIYYTEADRLETWGVDHIARASAHVIEYETDWNIDIEQDDDGSTSQLHVNIEDEVSTPRDGSMAAGSRAASMTPAPGQAPTLGRRGPRGPYKKHAQTALSEGLDAEGRMPGAKDGVGAFPAGSDWAELMIALKIKGKRYKTKKERLRFEKEGPPYHTDGSIDYGEMEDPFSILNVFVPESLSRPQVSPLYPPTSTTTTDGIQPRPQSRAHAPIPVTVLPDRPMPVLTTLSHIPAQPPAIPSTSAPMRPPKKRRHWTIVRNAPARSRAKDKETDGTVDEAKSTGQVPRDAGPTDYGTFATLLSSLAASAGAGTSAAEYLYGSEHRLYATIRSTVEHRPAKRKHETEEGSSEEGEGETFWTEERAEEGWDYVRNIVYGGVDGYAYVRSLAEFVAPSVYLCEARKEVDGDGDGTDAPGEDHERTLPLGVPLARYVEDNLVDMVTRGRHGLLRDVLLPDVADAVDSDWASICGTRPNSPFHTRMAALPTTAAPWSGEPLDMAALIRVPEELSKEGVLEGAPGEAGEHGEIERALMWGVEVIEALGRQGQDDAVKVEAVEGEEAMDLDRKPEPDVEAEEDPLVKRLRMNLLALAKRAPLDKIAKLPVELVPEDIRGIVPTA